MNTVKIKESSTKAAKGIYYAMPMIVSIVLLVGLANTLIPSEVYSTIFGAGMLSDSIIASAIGSILAGNPVNSYVISEELLSQGVSLLAVTAFIVAWVTVGVIQFPAEAVLLGRRFAIVRNITAFFLSIVVAIITVGLMGL